MEQLNPAHPNIHAVEQFPYIALHSYTSPSQWQGESQLKLKCPLRQAETIACDNGTLEYFTRALRLHFITCFTPIFTGNQFLTMVI